MPDLDADMRLLLAGLAASSRSRDECAAIVGSPVRSASALSRLRDARLVRFDREYGEWDATDAGRAALMDARP